MVKLFDLMDDCEKGEIGFFFDIVILQRKEREPQT